MNVSIHGLGLALPEHGLSQAQARALAGTYAGLDQRPRALDVLYRQTRIMNRNSVVVENSGVAAMPFFPPPVPGNESGPGTASRMQRYAGEVVPLAARACREALSTPDISAGDITHLVVVTCTGFFAPGLDVALIGELGLDRSASRFQLGFMGCHGALNGLQLSASIVNGDSAARVLLCAAELCSLHMQYGSGTDQAVSNSLFADGAAAAVLGAESPGGKHLARLNSFCSHLVPDSADAMSWRIGDHGFQMTLSARVPQLIEENLPGWIERWLAKSGLKTPDVAAWCVHPGGPRILDAVEKSLKLPASALSASREILAAHGNMSSPTVLFILDKLRKTHGQIPHPCVMLGFGPGLVIEAALLA